MPHLGVEIRHASHTQSSTDVPEALRNSFGSASKRGGTAYMMHPQHGDQNNTANSKQKISATRSRESSKTSACEHI
jgi:hypothetical protein